MATYSTRKGVPAHLSRFFCNHPYVQQGQRLLRKCYIRRDPNCELCLIQRHPDPALSADEHTALQAQVHQEWRVKQLTTSQLEAEFPRPPKNPNRVAQGRWLLSRLQDAASDEDY
jgi:hypothetical protein